MTDPTDLGTRWELLVDEALIDEMQGARLELQRPERREVALLADAPWEDDVAGFSSVVEEGETVRLYYRASIPDRSNESRVVFALAESTVEAEVLGPKPTVVRAIQSSTSTDFLEWTPVVHHEYEDEHSGMQLYTNATIPCPGAEHIYLSFPNRYVQERTLDSNHGTPGVNDALFMTSRDTVHWKRYAEAWVRPGLDELNWTDRNNYPTWGLVETSPTEWSMYISEHYRRPGIPCRLRRLAVRPHGFVSIHADYDGGEFTTRPITFTGRELLLNYSTSAAGWVKVEIQDIEGKPVPGFSMAEMNELYGDRLEGRVQWRGGPGLAALVDRPLRLRFALKDADLFAFRTAGDGGSV